MNAPRRHPLAKADIEREARCYEGKKPGLGADFLDEVSRVRHTPAAGLHVSGGGNGLVESAGAAVSMDGRGRWIANRFIERLWRSVKYEDVSLRDYLDGLDLGRGLGKWFADYNKSRPHQALNYACPEDV